MAAALGRGGPGVQEHGSDDLIGRRRAFLHAQHPQSGPGPRPRLACRASTTSFPAATICSLRRPPVACSERLFPCRHRVLAEAKSPVIASGDSVASAPRTAGSSASDPAMPRARRKLRPGWAPGSSPGGVGRRVMGENGPRAPDLDREKEGRAALDVPGESHADGNGPADLAASDRARRHDAGAVRPDRPSPGAPTVEVRWLPM